MGLVDLPAVADGVVAGPGGLGQQWRKPHHPAIHRDVVDLDPAFGEQLLEVAVGQAEAQVPAHREHDHIGREAEPGERRPGVRSRPGAAGSHAGSLAARAGHSQCNSAAEGHCCIEPECAGEAQQSGGSPSWQGAKKGSNHSTVPRICRLEQRSGDSRAG
jgi:hypothetical protein